MLSSEAARLFPLTAEEEEDQLRIALHMSLQPNEADEQIAVASNISTEVLFGTTLLLSIGWYL